MTRIERRLRRDALAILEGALRAADAGQAVRNHLSIRGAKLRAGHVHLALTDFDRIFVVAAGKAAAQMAAAVEEIMGDRLVGGVVVTKRGSPTSYFRYWRVVEAGHPIPDAAGAGASEKIGELCRELNARDLLIVLISGGASALMSAPAAAVTLAAKQATTDLLLRAGADIFELNAVRKHLSSLKGGRLAALAYPATVVSLLLSDVIGDPLDVIGSGPTAPDGTTFGDALGVLRKFKLTERVPASVREYLERGAQGEVAESPKPGDPIFANVHNVVVGSSRLALGAAARRARELGYRPLILSSSIQGESREAARVHAEILREVRSSGNPVRAPACILSGGETTVTVNGDGRGGRNQEFVLSMAIAISGLSDVLALSAGTDGTDGPTDAAGALATGETVARAKQLGLNASDYLARNDSYPFFEALGDLIKTGPTGTNVMDLNLLLSR